LQCTKRQSKVDGRVAKVITIAQQKGGAGKTTLATHLAVALGSLGRTVAMVDVDPQGTATHWYALRRGRLSGGVPGKFLTVSGWRASTEIDRLRPDFDVVIVDSPPHALTDAKIVIRAANLVVVPVQPSVLDLWATKPTIELAYAERRNVLLVLNRVPSRNPHAAEIAEAVGRLGSDLARGRLGNRAIYAAAMAEGRTATEAAPESLAARETLRLAREIAGRLGL
jgi:chromosome partitioning protein